MSSMLHMYGTTNESAQTTLDNMRLSSVSIANAFRNLSTYFMRPALGGSDLNWTVQTGAMQATATLTSTGTASNNETASIANQTLTAKTSGAVPANGEFNISGTVATQAANIALAINSLPALAGIVTATSSLGVTTITAVVPGVGGNGIQASESLTNVTLAAFSGGSNGTSVNIAKGI